jgi:hypothetical protein
VLQGLSNKEIASPPAAARLTGVEAVGGSKMRFYQIHIRCENGSSAGFEYFTNKEEAQKCLRENIENDPKEDHSIKVIEIKPTKYGILSALNIYASHPDNG